MKILLDPGHGKNGGAQASTKQNEARTNYNVTMFLAAFLTKAGHDVTLTRASHEDAPSLEARNAIMRRINPDIAISIHHNAANKIARGAEVLAQVKDKNGGSSKRLAEQILMEFIKTGQRSRGIVFKQNSSQTGDYYGFLRAAAEAQITAVITEYAFMDNDQDLQLVNTYEKQERQAKAIANAVEAFITKG